MVRLVIWDAMGPIMTSLWWYNEYLRHASNRSDKITDARKLMAIVKMRSEIKYDRNRQKKSMVVIVNPVTEGWRCAYYAYMSHLIFRKAESM